MKVIYKQYYDFPFEVAELKEGSKLIKHQRISGLYIFKETTGNAMLMEQHNAILKEIELLQEELRAITNKMQEPVK